MYFDIIFDKKNVKIKIIIHTWWGWWGFLHTWI